MKILTAAALALCFGQPQPVSVEGYRGHIMEPFIARDGGSLFFNSRNAPGDQTDIFYARRIDDLHFQFVGAVAGANSAALDGVASLARDGTFALISPRDYDRTQATIWTGHWRGDRVADLHLEAALSPHRPLWFNMDAEISANGQHLYFTDNAWSPIGPPRGSDLHLAVRTNGVWRRAPEYDRWFARINTRALEYAAATSADERELYFTRLTTPFLGTPQLEIMVATRATTAEPFSAPARIRSITGFVEGPTDAPDGALFFHAKINDLYQLMRASRTCPLTVQ